MKFATFVLILLVLNGCVQTTVPVSSPAAAAMPTVSTAGFGAALNAQRAANARAALNLDARLATAAQAHADDMAAHGYFSHTGRNGSSFSQRIKAQGYGTCFMAENIAQGQQTEAAVLTTWMGSAGHRANILDARAKSYGLGRSGSTWVMTLGGC